MVNDIGHKIVLARMDYWSGAWTGSRSQRRASRRDAVINSDNQTPTEAAQIILVEYEEHIASETTASIVSAFIVDALEGIDDVSLVREDASALKWKLRFDGKLANDNRRFKVNITYENNLLEIYPYRPATDFRTKNKIDIGNPDASEQLRATLLGAIVWFIDSQCARYEEDALEYQRKHDECKELAGVYRAKMRDWAQGKEVKSE
jgi:hypothetical protein